MLNSFLKLALASFAFIPLICTQVQSQSIPEIYTSSSHYNYGINYTVYWDVSDEVNFNLLIQADTTGWVGFGITKGGGMNQADIVIAWVDDSDNTAHVSDRFSTTTSTPVADEDLAGTNDWSVLSFTQTQTTITIELTRPLTTTDANDWDLVYGQGLVNCIFAYNSNDPIDNVPAYHTGRWAGSLDIFGTVAVFDPDDLPENTEFVDFFFPENYSPPTVETSYMCTGFTVSGVPDSHAIAFEPIIDASAVTHHMLLYQCDSDVSSVNDPQDCATMQCTEIIYAWAVGVEPWVLPDAAGIIWGGEDKYYQLEIHYNNPSGLQLTDSSGVRIYYNSNKRQYDAGFLRFGTDLGDISIPAGKAAYELTGECGAETTNDIVYLPEQKITFFGVLLHMHALGRQIWVDVIRATDTESTDPEVLGDDCFYDYNFQQIQMIDPFELYPGDRIKSHCVFDSTGRDMVTLGGDATSDEMCVAFGIYYPAVSGVTKCIESVTHGVQDADGRNECGFIGDESVDESVEEGVDEATGLFQLNYAYAIVISLTMTLV